MQHWQGCNKAQEPELNHHHDMLACYQDSKQAIDSSHQHPDCATGGTTPTLPAALPAPCLPMQTFAPRQIGRCKSLLTAATSRFPTRFRPRRRRKAWTCTALTLTCRALQRLRAGQRLALIQTRWVHGAWLSFLKICSLVGVIRGQGKAKMSPSGWVR